MTSGETPRAPENYTRQGYEFCESILHAVELREASNKLARISHHATSDLIHKSSIEKLPFELRVYISEETEAYITIDDDVQNDNPSSFDATEIRAIDEHGVEFFDRVSGAVLRINGYKFEIDPIFDSPDLPN